MRLGWRDGSASLFVIAAGVLYALWQSGTALQGMSTRALGAVVFALGYAACMSDRAEMAVVYGVGGRRRAPMAYIVVASVLGFGALVASVITRSSAPTRQCWPSSWPTRSPCGRCRRCGMRPLARGTG